jgi:hypothetical protein
MAAWSSRQSLMRPVPRWRVGIFYIAAFSLGLTAYAWLAQSWKVWVGMLVASALAFFLANRSRSHYAGEPPSALEVGAGMLGRLGGGATISAFGAFFYIAIGWVRSFFSANEGIEFWGALPLVGLFAFAFVFGDAGDFTKALYPSHPGQRSPYSQHVDEKSEVRRLGLRIAAIVGVVVLVAMLYFYDVGFSRGVLTLIATVGVMVATATYIGAKTIDAAGATPDSAVSAVQALLEQVGYRVVVRPRTGDEETDSAISNLDFLAIRPDHAMAGRVDVRANPDDGELSIEAASLESAVWVLQDELEKKNSAIRIAPVLIALDDKEQSAHTSTTSTAGKSVTIVHAPSEPKLTALVGASDKGALKSTAERLFGLFEASARGAT